MKAPPLSGEADCDVGADGGVCRSCRACIILFSQQSTLQTYPDPLPDLRRGLPLVGGELKFKIILYPFLSPHPFLRCFFVN